MVVQRGVVSGACAASCLIYTRAAAAAAVAEAGRRLPLLSNTRRQAAKPLQEQGAQAEASQKLRSASASGYCRPGVAALASAQHL